MSSHSNLKSWQHFALLASLFALLTNNFNAFAEDHKLVHHDAATEIKTESPIKHVIVLIGENRTFDHLFGTYAPKEGETVSNLLSKGIINADGTPGPNFSLAQQFEAIKPFQSEYFISLGADQKKAYKTLPQPTLNFALLAPHFPPGTPASLLGVVEPSLEPQDLNLLTTGAGTQFSQDFIQPDPDTRIAVQQAAERSLFARWSSATIRLLHRRYHAPIVRNVVTIRLQRRQRHAGKSFRMPERSLSLRHYQLHQPVRSFLQRH